MKKLPLTLLALLACTILFGGLITYLPASSAVVEEVAPSVEKYVNKEKNYSLEYPKAWQKQELPPLDLIILSPPKNAETKAQATMNLVSEKVGDKVSLEQFYTESVKHLTTELKEAKVEKSGDLNIHGIPSKWIQYSHNMMESNFRVLQYFLVAQGNIYLMTFSAAADDFDHFRPTFESIATSFKELPQTSEKEKS